MLHFILNDLEMSTDLPPATTVLDFVRYHKNLTGTKIGCREGDCGACTVLIGEIKNKELVYRSMTSCLLPIANVEGKHVVTIEGINLENKLNPIQQAMSDAGATQCGFCTPGFVMSLAGFCLTNHEPSQQTAIASIDGNICRCTGYKSIERAATVITDLLHDRKKEAPEKFLSRLHILPYYFSTIKKRLQRLKSTPLTVHGSRFTVISGGTDLYVQRHDELTHAKNSFVFNHDKLKKIEKKGKQCVLGPSVTVTDLLESKMICEYFPEFRLYAKLVSSTPIRNMATLAGNFVNASPIGDFTVFFLALDASVDLGKIKNFKSKRTVPLRTFYKGYKKLDKKSNEVITGIRFDLPGKHHCFNFEKVSKRTHLDIATVNTAINLKMEKGKISSAGLSAGGVAPIPLFLEKTSKFLKGKIISSEVVDEAIRIAQNEISPISDARGSKEYKTLLLGQLIKAHFLTLFPKIEFEKQIVGIEPLRHKEHKGTQST